MKIKENKQGVLELYDFNQFEAYKIAVKLEKDGKVFYEKMLSCLEDPKAKQVVEILIKEEEEHLDYFLNCLFKEQQKAEDGFEQDDIVEYMDSNIFIQLPEDIFNLSEKDLINLGKKAEQESINFYNAILKNSLDPNTKGVLEKIIQDEKKHLDEIIALEE